MEGCDVPEGKTGGCGRETYIGFRPLSEPRGRKVCEEHWTRHNDPADPFNLFDAFGFKKRPAKRRTRASLNRAAPVGCGRAPSKPVVKAEPKPTEPVHEQPLVKPEPPQEKPEHHETEKPIPEPEPALNDGPRCKACGGEREAGHTYCSTCGRERKRQAHQQRQRRYREKHVEAVKA